MTQPFDPFNFQPTLLKYRRADTAAGLRIAKKISEQVGAAMAAEVADQPSKPGMLDGFTMACKVLAEQFEAYAVHMETGEIVIPEIPKENT